VLVCGKWGRLRGGWAVARGRGNPREVPWGAGFLLLVLIVVGIIASFESRMDWIWLLIPAGAALLLDALFDLLGAVLRAGLEVLGMLLSGLLSGVLDL
jgi:hypothetical protein